MYKRTRWGFTFLALFTAGCIWLLYSVGDKFPLGIDLKGGTELIYELDLSHVPRDTRTVANEVKDIIARRLNTFGLKELSLAVEGDNRLVVQLPGSGEATVKSLKDQIQRAGTLTFHLVDSTAQAQRRIVELRAEEKRYKEDLKVWAKKMRAWRAGKDADPAYDAPPPGERPEAPRLIVREMRDEEGEGPQPPLILKNTPDAIVEGSWLSWVGLSQDEYQNAAVGFQLRGEGATRMGDITQNNMKGQLAVVLDDHVESAPVIRGRIATNGQITSTNFTDTEVRALITVLRGGSLPTSPRLISEATVGSVFGQESIDAGSRAVLVGLGTVMLFISIYYLAAGFVTNFVLVFNVLVVLAYVVTFRQDLTLPGIAGILLTIGMAVDANILIFERVREERRRGKALVPALATGYHRAFSVIFDSNLTTVITSVVLFYFGTGPIKGFAVTLFAGIVVSFVSALFVTRLILSFAINRGWVRNLHMMHAFETPRVPFVSFQRPFLLASVLIIAAAWVLVSWRGWDNYGVDFTGGARIRMKLREPIALDPQQEGDRSMRAIVRSLVVDEPELFRGATLQTIGVIRAGEHQGKSYQFALLTRAGAIEEGIAEAQQAGEEAGPRRPEAATKPPAANEDEPGDGKEESGKAGPVSSPETTGTAGPGETAGGTSPAGTARGGEGGRDDKTGAAQRVKEALQKALAAEKLLLPQAIPESLEIDGVAHDQPYWLSEGESTKEALVLEVNLLRINEMVVLEDWIRGELSKTLLDFPSRLGEEEPVEKIAVEEVRIVSKARDENDVTRVQVRLTPYSVPSTGEVSDLPSKEALLSVVTRFFSDPPKLEGGDTRSEPFEICEPFPQVATVGPRVATDLQGLALVAIFISMLGIIFYISLRFEFIFGLAAIAALVHDIMITIGVIALTDHFLGDIIPVKINLPELAALLTIIGYSINDTIVVFDRIRENLRTFAKKKLSFRDCVDMSINQTLSRTVWTSATTLFTVLSLLILGGEAVRGFAFTFAIGLVAGTYSSVFVASPVLILLHDRSEARRAEAAKAAA